MGDADECGDALAFGIACLAGPTRHCRMGRRPRARSVSGRCSSSTSADGGWLPKRHDADALRRRTAAQHEVYNRAAAQQTASTCHGFCSWRALRANAWRSTQPPAMIEEEHRAPYGPRSRTATHAAMRVGPARQAIPEGQGIARQLRRISHSSIRARSRPSARVDTPLDIDARALIADRAGRPIRSVSLRSFTARSSRPSRHSTSSTSVAASCSCLPELVVDQRRFDGYPVLPRTARSVRQIAARS